MFSLSKTIAQAASTGLVLGAIGCGGSGANMPDAKAPSASDATAAAAGAKECCKGKNECKGKGSCKTDANSCAGQNECKGKGGCNGHCPK
jgi:hypothetical protein